MAAPFSPGIAQGEVVPIRSCSAYSAKLLDEMGRLVSIHQGEQLIREQYAAECPCSRSLTWYVVGRMGVPLGDFCNDRKAEVGEQVGGRNLNSHTLLKGRAV